MDPLSIGQLAMRAQSRSTPSATMSAPACSKNPVAGSPATAEVVGRLRFVRRAKDLGFTLGEITELLSLSAQGESDMAAMKAAAQAKLDRVEDKRRELERIRKGLRPLIAAYPAAVARWPSARSSMPCGSES